MNRKFRLKGAIFDLDGTLLDSMGLWEPIDIQFLAKRDLTATDDYIRAVTPMGFQEAAEYTIRRFGLSESAADITAEWRAMAAASYAHDVRLKPHVREYLRLVKKRGVKIGAATALTPDLYGPALKNNGIYDWFDAFTSLSEVPRGKGFPDIYLLTAEKLGLPPSDCMVFEDIADGIKGAKAGGFHTCGVYDRYSEFRWDIIQYQSDRYIYDFQQLLPGRKPDVAE